ncbi:uncharacterized protein LOC106161174 [Lingula anatina]|uniref:Uncharacterized protein LOC106161174 n=1 Tax=Lingula anatina TaxID=7574 RepID=A0A1S3I5E9_LINAN|nr:uncharacterized protein LOC106161174 [Lingula anatina]|eukprot:XP_013393500.1 uncharacterized protein LOC106161174 [Lingula anatina]
MVMDTCLGCLNLRQGTIASGVWSSIWSCVMIGIDAFNLWEYTSHLAYYLRGYTVSNHYAPLTGYLTCIIVLAVIWLLTSGILFFGVCMKNKNPWLFLPWVITTVIISLAYIGDCIMYFMYVSVIWGIITICIFLVLISSNIYALLCVGFYFKLLRKGKDAPHERSRSRKSHAREGSQKKGTSNKGYEYPLGERPTPEYPKHGFRGQRYASRSSEHDQNQMPPPYEEHSGDRV